ncbi:PaaI family thioesterase [Methylobacterium platani]|uniref:Thioesterase n=2 Tax=Methylobacterium platani TaxID=427683 RepID=A0A179S359_9HYPH|nr:PaaI family thioesterase [Methylobacterium platani]KMO12894.1 thioesterase [Methylobacterium platani JCM 14648]OAS20181.1 thioesterase [Methylobacterium platani]
MTTPDFDPAGWRSFDDPGFLTLVGPVLLREEGEAVSFAFRAEAKHANLIGVVQGGMMMTFADRALGFAAMRAAGGANCVTVQFEMQFVAAGRIGETITMTPEVVRRTSSLVFLRGDARSQGHIVATATGVWKILRRRPDGA